MSAEASLRFKLNKKLKLATGRSKNLKDGNNKVEITRDKDRNGNLKPTGFDRRKKRIFAEHDTDEEVTTPGNAKAPKRKVLLMKGQSHVKDDSYRQKNMGKSRSIWVSSKVESFGHKHSSRKVKDTVQSARASNRTNAEVIDEMDGGGTGSLKKHFKSKSGSSKRLDLSLEKSLEKHTKSKYGSSKRLDLSQEKTLEKHTKSKSGPSKRPGLIQEKSPDVSPRKSSKTIFLRKRGLDDDSEVVDDQPKKKKRVIRIDPHDISNKRLDDGIVIDECAKEKKTGLEKEKENEMSKNAQFRAILPSPSILSFVEDNLLGRRRLIELRRAGYNIELSAPLDNIPCSTSAERERIEENIFRNKLTFFAAAKASSSFPPPDLPEIAFAGRSNVGKSSLLNALTRQWGVVRTSDKPGLTQTINFFNLGSKLCLVDLPGYGFAYAKEEVKDAWEELVKEYVSTRVGLKRVCLLIDTKWGMKPRDHELIDLMERSQTKYQIVLTKTDVVFPIDVARRAMQIEESLKANKSVVQPVMMASSKSGAGIRSLRTVLSKIARFAKL